MSSALNISRTTEPTPKRARTAQTHNGIPGISSLSGIPHISALLALPPTPSAATVALASANFAASRTPPPAPFLHSPANFYQPAAAMNTQDASRANGTGAQSPYHFRHQHQPFHASTSHTHLSAMQLQPRPAPAPAPVPPVADDANDDYNYSGDEAEYFEETNRYKHLFDPDSVLMQLVDSFDWRGAYSRVSAYPRECKVVGERGRTPLHVACDHDAPPELVTALLRAYPEASLMVGTSDMNPLHITCSSEHASVHIVRILLEGGYHSQTSMQDVDGDTPLHAACRCGAPVEVIDELLRANPSAVHKRDHEGLTPLLRLWVRYFVKLGKDAINAVQEPSNLKGELGEAWKRTIVLLRCAHLGSMSQTSGKSNKRKVKALDVRGDSATSAFGGCRKKNRSDDFANKAGAPSTCAPADGITSPQQAGVTAAVAPTVTDCNSNTGGADEDCNDDDDTEYVSDDDEYKTMVDTANMFYNFRVLHAASAVDCPRAVVQIATRLYPQQLRERDENGMTPLHIAAQAPIYQERDLSDEGYTLENRILGDTENGESDSADASGGASAKQVGVIDILLSAYKKAAFIRDSKTRRLPLHFALESGKTWDQGISALLDANPDSVKSVDPKTGLYPAINGACDLDTIFALLRQDPSVLMDAVPGQE